MNVSEGIARLKALRARLARPLDFYSTNLPAWLDLARALTAAVLVNAQPAEADAQDWAARSAAAVERVAGRLVSKAPVGVVLALSDVETGLPADASAKAQEAYERHPVTVSEVERWVAAGREKTSISDLGKNLDERDTGESDTQIAWKVLTAINHDRPGSAGLMAAIQKFLDAERAGGDIPPELYEAILRAWMEVFPALAAEAWRAWVRSAVAAA